MKTIKKIAYAVITIVIVVSILSLTHFSGETIKPTQQWNAEQIKENSTLVGYTVEYDEADNTYTYKSFLEIAHIILPHDGSNFNTVVVKFSEDFHPEPIPDEEKDEDVYEVEELATPRVYYNSDNNGFFVSGDYCEPTDIEESNTLVFRSYNPAPKNTIALNMDCDIVIEEISVYMLESSDVTVKFNFTALLLICVVLLLLLVCEKHFGYFAWIRAMLMKEISLIKELAKNRRRFLIIHLLALSFTVVFVVLIAMLIMLNYYTATAIIAVFIISIPTVAFQLIDKISSQRDASAAKLFLIVAFLVGIMMSYTSPTTVQTAWDDEIHFRNSYVAADPFDEDTSFAKYGIFNRNYSIKDYIEDPSHFARIMVAESQVKTEYSYGQGNFYTLLSYSPMIVAIAFLNLLGVDIVKILVLCRFAMLLSFIYICYRGIRKLRGGGLVFSAVCLLPGILYLACSISYDSWLIAWFVYAFASIFSVLQQHDRKFTTSELVKILLALFVACSPKSIYCVMLLPLLFIGKDKFVSTKQAKGFRIFTVVTVIVIAAILIIPGVFVYDLYTDPRGGDNVDSFGQIMFILTHPLSFLGILLKHFGKYFSLTMFNRYSTAYGFLDGYEGSLDPFVGTLAGALLMFAIIADRKNDETSLDMRRMRITTVLSCFATVAVISASMYVAYNDVGSSIINGCQFRYVFPLLAPLLFFFRSSRIRLDLKQQRSLSVIFGGISFNLMFGYLWAYIYKFFIL